MDDGQTCESLPDILLDLGWQRPINIADFRGQKLVVFFCAGTANADEELCDYDARAEAFHESGVWVIGVLEQAEPSNLPHMGKEPGIRLALDPNGAAWGAFSAHLPRDLDHAGAVGMTFVFERDGRLRKAWTCGGKAGAALEAARERP